MSEPATDDAALADDPALADEFPLDPSLCYLNHAAVAPWPRRAREAVDRFCEENLRHGALHYPEWTRIEQRLRERLARLVHAESSDEIALLKNTSEALSVVAYGLDWRPGDSVVISDQEFPSNRIVWESLGERFGVTVRPARLDDPDRSPEQAVIDCLDAKTRLVSLSAVQYGSGLRLDLARIGQACRAAGVLFCVDAIQAVGALDLDVRAIAADFLMADGHKWMLGPEGIALFYCRRACLERLRLNQFGWHMVAHPGDYDRPDWRPAPSARRFEPGSPNMLGIHALDASIGLLLETGMTEVERRVLARQRYLARAIAGHGGYRLLSPTTPGQDAGIVTFTPRDGDPEALHARLARQGVCCAQRLGGIRFSPHFHTRRSDLDRALALLGIEGPA